MGQRVSVVAKHKYLLEFISSTDGQLEDVLFGLSRNSTQIANSIPYCCG